MKSIVLSIILLPLTLIAAQPPQKLTINNNSGQNITVYYGNQLTRYTMIEALKSQTITLMPLPQDITVHFDRLNFQQLIPIEQINNPLTIGQCNIISITQNGKVLSKKIQFSAHRPNLTIHEED